MKIHVWLMALALIVPGVAWGDDLTVTSFLPYAGQTNILLQADGNVIFTGGSLSLPALPAGASVGQLVVQAGNNITVNDGTAIIAGSNWSISMTAGTSYPGTIPGPGNGGIYLSGSASLQSQNGDIVLSATNEIIINTGGVCTAGGGSIEVLTAYGNVDSGTGTAGFVYSASAPYFSPANPSGISTAAGGNVTINAGGDVISFPALTPGTDLPLTPIFGDPGTGAFGAKSGDVTISAGGSVYGHFVEVNGTGTIHAGQDIGNSEQNVALSLVTGSWNLNAGWNQTTQTVQAGTGDIYLQEVRNPNGVFNNTMIISHGRRVPSAGYHLFNYDSQAAVTLNAGDGIYMTGSDLPRPDDAVPMLLPPMLNMYAGPGGITLQTPSAVGVNNVNVAVPPCVTLFPSPCGNLQIITTGGGDLSGMDLNGSPPILLMSDSSRTQWTNSVNPAPFDPNDHSAVPTELTNASPVVLNIAGDMDNLHLQVCKLAQITVGGDLNGCTFFGENLHTNDVTSITAAGQIVYPSAFTSVTLDTAFPDLQQLAQGLPAEETYLPPGAADFWYSALALAVDPAQLPTTSLQGDSPAQLAGILNAARMYPANNINSTIANYDPTNRSLSVVGSMSPNLLNELLSPTLTLALYGTNGVPLLDANGHLETETIFWVQNDSADYNELNSLYANSQGKPPLQSGAGLFVAGPGQFDVSAGSIDLGSSTGILSLGNAGTSTYLFLGLANYSFLTPYLTSGATVNVTLAGDLNMPFSTIATLGGGNVNIASTGGMMNLGSPELTAFEEMIMQNEYFGLGIYTSGGGDVSISASGDINVAASRIATFDGGNIFVESFTGDVNAGAGDTGLVIPVNFYSPNYFSLEPVEFVMASGIAALTLENASQIPGAATVPGDITVLTPRGNISSDQGGILQATLDGALPVGPTIALIAGTPGPGGWPNPPLYVGNIDLADSGVIGGTLVLEATGDIAGPGLNISMVQTNGTSTVSWSANGVRLAAGDISDFVIETSPDLFDWTAITPAVSINADGSLSFESPVPADSSCGFYRIQWR